MNYCSIIFRALQVNAKDKQEFEIFFQNIFSDEILSNYIRIRQKIASDHNILLATADWNDYTKIYRLIFAGDNVEKFIKKLTAKKEYNLLINELDKNKVRFIDIKYYADDYQKALPCWFTDEKLLPGHPDRGTLEWHTSDSQSEFKKNQRKQPHNWVYRTKKVSYDLNSHGYRCAELETIDWSNSIVLFGCSMTSSVGLDEEDTLSKNMTEILDIPVISLGVAGSSPQYNFDNSIKLKENFPEPLCVIHLWSEYLRTVEYSESIKHQKTSWLGESSTKTPESHLAINTVNYHKVSALLWKNYLAYSFFTSTAMLLNIPELPIVDFSRDLSHYGSQTSKLIADRISQDVLKLL